MKRSLINSIVVVCFVSTCFVTPAKATLGMATDVGVRFSPTGGYGQAKSDDPFGLVIFTTEGDVDADGFISIGFDSFIADSSYALRVGVIPTTLWTGTDSDWDTGIYLHVEWTGGSIGRAYTVIDGISDPDVLGAIYITDLLGGVDSYSFNEVLAGSPALGIIDSYIEQAPNIAMVTQGYPGSPTTGMQVNPSNYGSCYLIAQVKDLNLTNHEISVDMWYGEVPEPATLLLLGLGALALRRRKA